MAVKKLTATTIAKMTSRSAFGKVRGLQVIPNKKKTVPKWRRKDDE